MQENYHVKWNFPLRLKEAMEDNMATPLDFEDAGICAESSIKSYLRGKNIPNLRTAQAIAEYLGVSLDYLCGDGEK